MLLEVGYSQVYERLLIGEQPSDSIADGGAGIDLQHDTPSDLRTCINTPCYWDASYDQTRPWFRDAAAGGPRDGHPHAELLGRRLDHAVGPVLPERVALVCHRLAQLQGRHAVVARQRRRHADRNGQSAPCARGRRARGRHRLQLHPTTLEHLRQAGPRHLRPGHLDDRPADDQRRRPVGVVQVGDQHLPHGRPARQGRFIPARSATSFDQEPFWNDVTPRFSVVYDLFGDSRTALKFSANRFMRPYTSGHAERYSPFREVSDIRDWLDCALDPGIFTPGAPVTCLSAL